MSNFVEQITSGQIDWAQVTPENVLSVSQAFFSSAKFARCIGARTLNEFLHSFESEFMLRKYLLLIS